MPFTAATASRALAPRPRRRIPTVSVLSTEHRQHDRICSADQHADVTANLHPRRAVSGHAPRLRRIPGLQHLLPTELQHPGPLNSSGHSVRGRQRGSLRRPRRHHRRFRARHVTIDIDRGQSNGVLAPGSDRCDQRQHSLRIERGHGATRRDQHTLRTVREVDFHGGHRQLLGASSADSGGTVPTS